MNDSHKLAAVAIIGFATLGCVNAPDRPNAAKSTGLSPTKAVEPATITPLAARSRPTGPRVASTSTTDKSPSEPPKVAKVPAVDSASDPQRQRDEIKRLFALTSSASTSIGSSDEGTLVGGVPLPNAGPGFIHNPVRPSEAGYGTVETIQIIIRSAATLDKVCPGKSLFVNDISGPQGGPLAHHWSHQSGRDVDILFFYLDVDGRPVDPIAVPLDPKGWGWDFMDLAKSDDDRRLRIDVDRTWCFIRALVETAGSLLHRIFIAEHLRTMLIEHAERIGAPATVRERFADVTCQPSTPHDDHLHVRFFCTAEDIAAGCQDMSPIYPWRRKELQKQGVEPVLARIDSDRYAKANRRVVSAAQAERKAGPMHWRVKQFLDQRKSWLPKPHPGRPWCQ